MPPRRVVLADEAPSPQGVVGYAQLRAENPRGPKEAKKAYNARIQGLRKRLWAGKAR